MRSIRISSEDTSAKEIRVTRLLLISFRNNFSSCLPVPYTYIYIILWWNTFLYSWLYAKVTEALLYQLPCAWFSYRKKHLRIKLVICCTVLKWLKQFCTKTLDILFYMAGGWSCLYVTQFFTVFPTGSFHPPIWDFLSLSVSPGLFPLMTWKIC